MGDIKYAKTLSFRWKTCTTKCIFDKNSNYLVNGLRTVLAKIVLVYCVKYSSSQGRHLLIILQVLREKIDLLSRESKLRNFWKVYNNIFKLNKYFRKTGLSKIHLGNLTVTEKDPPTKWNKKVQRHCQQIVKTLELFTRDRFVVAFKSAYNMWDLPQFTYSLVPNNYTDW